MELSAFLRPSLGEERREDSAVEAEGLAGVKERGENEGDIVFIDKVVYLRPA